MRLFVGVPVPAADAYRTVTMELAAVAPGVRPVPAGSWHITLRFLGEGAAPEPVATALDNALAGLQALNGLVEGLGAFPSPPQARVAWAGVQAFGIQSLAQKVRDATARMGQPERQDFHPHVTLARIDPPKDIHALTEQHKETGFSEGWLDKVVLWRSDLGPGGPKYTALHTVALARPEE